MKNENYILIFILQIGFSFSAKAQDLNIIHSIPSPVGLSLDIAFDGQDLWIGNGYEDSLLYKVSRVDGTVLKTIIVDPLLTPAGLTFANGYLFVTDTGPSLIHKIDTTDGTIIQTYFPPFDMDGYPSGLTWDGSSFWLINANAAVLYQLDTDFEVIQTIPGILGSFGSGLAFVNESLWYTENITDQLFALDTVDFDIEQTFDITQGIYPNGLAFDGQYLWLALANANDFDVDSIYQIDLGLPPPVSVDNQKQVVDLNVFPNPVDEVLYFDLEFEGPHHSYELIVYNSLGKQIRSQKIENKITSVDVNNLPPGTYIFTLKTNNKTIQAGQFVVF